MKKTKFTRSLSLALALFLLCAALPFGALAAETGIVELVATDVMLDETNFEYTGGEIRPNVTVRVQDHLLTLDKDYHLTYRNNVEVGQAAVVVTGIATSGYMGTVEHPFYINPKTSDDSQPDLITIIGTDVVIDGTEFVATGEPIEPGITVTVDGKKLTAGEEYTLAYENNVQPGSASVTVTGVEDKGYTGCVTIHFTIQAASEDPTEPEQTLPEDTTPEQTEPEQTEPEQTEPEATEPEETTPVSYKITKGNGAIWRRESGKNLSFTSDGAFRDFEGLQVDGKTVSSKYYTVGENTVVTLKESFLESLKLGKHTITLQFEDGSAEGSFKTAAAADDSNPKTGDDFALHGWAALLFISFTGIIGAAFAYRKKIWK